MLYIKVKKTKNMGWGVYADKDFFVGDQIEICPAVPLTEEELKSVESTRLENWFFEWHNFEESALIMGYGMIYNHSSTPNAKYEFDFENEFVTVVCTAPIKKGQQIFLNYNQTRTTDEPVSMFHPVTKKTVVFVDGKLKPNNKN